VFRKFTDESGSTRAMNQVRREVDLGFVAVSCSTFTFSTHSQVDMSLIVLMSGDNAGYDASSFSSVSLCPIAVFYLGGFLHDTLAG
jgi:hypothetical protein